MYPDLSTVFNEFCKYFDGKFKWNLLPAQRTEAILNFFSELYKKQYTSLKENPLKEEREYMNIDYLWRYTRGSYQKIELVVEHENEFNLEDFLKNEIRHLLDIKAYDKIAITYPQSGEERELVNKVKEEIKSYPTKLSEHFEHYLLILGFATRKGGKPAVRFKGYLFDNNGELKDIKDQTILQAP